MTTPFWPALENFLRRIRPWREPLSLVIDASVIALAWQFTYLFRLGFERWISARAWYDGWVLLGVIATYMVCFMALKVPKAMWRFAGFGEIKRMAWACLLAGLICAVWVQMAQLVKTPRAVLALHPIVALMGLTLVRIGYRMLYEHMRGRIAGATSEVRRALVLGAGQAARWLIAGVQHDGWVIAGLLDDDPAKRGARVAGVRVLGAIDEVEQHAQSEQATHLVLAIPSLKPDQRRRVLELAAGSGLPLLTVPSKQELERGVRERVRDIQPEDLLGREPVQLDEAGISDCLRNKVVLITGAGGSIGGELCRQVALYGPKQLVLFDLCEFNLYAIEQELGERFPHLGQVKLLGDVKDEAHITRVCREYRPNIVFHAAAYKHVPLMEEQNAWLALRNNTLGTYYAATAAAASGAERFVLISTDKAVNPTNVMGASKRAAEMLISHLAMQGHRTTFTAVRFGNVLGSSGSVIPKFKEQIAKGGPVTVTHPEITRYFMTISESALLVLQAATLATTGHVYVLEMGEAVKIVELARDLIRLSGHRNGQIDIVFTGLRPGEKLYEELLADADYTLESTHPRIRVARLQDPANSEWARDLIDWIERIDSSAPPTTCRRALKRFVAEYTFQ
jgi:FlaA1/EpsC-like NDP-sugar epimerase